MNEDISMKIIKGDENIEDALNIRRKVFIEEQDVKESIEQDNLDKDAIHIILYFNQKPVSTGRAIFKNEKCYLGRIATLKEYRGKGFDKILVNEIVQYLLIIM